MTVYSTRKRSAVYSVHEPKRLLGNVLVLVFEVFPCNVTEMLNTHAHTHTHSKKFTLITPLDSVIPQRKSTF